MCARREQILSPPPGSELQSAPIAIGVSALKHGPTSAVAAIKAKGVSPSSVSPRRVLRVGVADLPRYFKELEDTLPKLNDVQDRFFFESVEVVPPLGAWEIMDSHSYLHAERFAKMLAEKPHELGLDYLICVTNRRMRDDACYNIYGWWSSNTQLNVMMFSTFGLVLESLGPVAGRIIANQMVELLGAQMVESASGVNVIHEKPPVTCPFYYNKERDPEFIAGRHKFHKPYYNKMLKNLPNALDPSSLIVAFERLLGAYDEQLGDVK